MGMIQRLEAFRARQSASLWHANRFLVILAWNSIGYS